VNPGRFWWGWIAATVAVYVGFWALLKVADIAPRPGPLLLLVALAMSVLALVNLSVDVNGASWDVQSSQSVTEPGQDSRLGMYVRTLTGHLDSRTPDTGLRDRLASLAAGRLAQRRRLGLYDPAAAAVLGPEVTAILTGPARRLSRSEIETCVRSIEQI
jgi:hypothetical protein